MNTLRRAVTAFLLLKLSVLILNLWQFPVLRRSPNVSPPIAAPPARPQPPQASLLVPMRNEAARLAASIPAMLAQGADEIIMLDDESADGTGALARALVAEHPGARVVDGVPAPPGWVGKNWACHQLAAKASSPLLIFCDADVLLAELKRLQLEIFDAIEAAVAKATNDLGFLRLDPEAFARSPSKSIDYAVMEKTDRAAVVAGDFRWSDIGSWDALFDITPRDAAGNVVHGPAVTMDATGNIVHSDGRLVTAVGVKDLVIVSTSDAVMVVPRARSQEVRELVAEVKAAKRPEATDHRRVHRPWGYYESIDMGERFQVKRIVVKQGGRLSLQMHHHRAEHWVVVRGTARVTIDDSVKILHENESIYVPSGARHRLENPGKIDLELIEVQTGSYLGEDDIVRLEDDYHRR